jgi:dihydroorotate dehydrogenase electron transfer subunit
MQLVDMKDKSAPSSMHSPSSDVHPQSSIPHPPSSTLNFFHGSVPVIENVPLARVTYRIRLHCPNLAQSVRPGQFIMIRLPGTNDPLLGRPFALYDTVLDPSEAPIGIDVVYLVVGKLTGLLAKLKPGDSLEVWGPLGNGFPDLTGLDHVGLVAGGIGQTPFLAYFRELLGSRGYGNRPRRRAVQRVSLFYGVRSSDFLAGVEDFRNAGAEVHLATDDGSLGFKGLVTDLLAQHDRPQHLIGCGPGPMMSALARQAQQWEIPCHLSLETPMACGLGICFSCVTKVKTPESPAGWDYRRACVDGPVFNAADLA